MAKRKGPQMSEADTLTGEPTGMDNEVEGVVGEYIETTGWTDLFSLLERIAERRQEGRIGGMMQAAVNFLAEGSAT